MLLTILRSAILILLLLFTLPQEKAKSRDMGLDPLTQELMSITMEMQPGKIMDVARVKQLVAQGADVRAKLPNGATPFLLAVETYAYLTVPDPTYDYAPGSLDAAKQVIEFLLTKNVDISAQDGRSMTPAMYLLYFGARYAGDVKEIFNLLVAAKADMGVQGDETGTALVHLMADGNYPYYFDTVMAHPEVKVDLTAIDKRKVTVLHKAAKKSPAVGGKLWLDEMIRLLPKQFVLDHIDQPDITGETPLSAAIRAGNVTAVDYILANYHPDLSRINVDDQNPLSIALELGDAKVIASLKKAGAPVQPVQDPSTIYCDKANHFDLSPNLLGQIIAKCSLKTIDELLPLIPPSLRSNYALVYRSRSLQDSSFSHPRVILFRRDGKLLMGFNGDPSHKGYKQLEVVGFNDAKKSFEYYDVDGSGPTLKMSGANPAKCLTCHRQDPRPNWDHWSFWPGVYGGDMLRHYPQEKAMYALYQNTLNSPNPNRYKNLLPISATPVKTVFGDADEKDFENAKIDDLMDSLMGQKTVRDIKNSAKLVTYRYAILGALTCKDRVETFLPDAINKTMPRTYDDLLKETQALAIQEMNDRFAFQNQALPGTPVGRYNILATAYYPGAYGYDYDTERTAALRYLVEGLLGVGSMKSWFSRFDNGKERYIATTFTNVEGLAWQELLDPTADKALYDLYMAEWPKISTAGSVFTWIYNDGPKGSAGKICPLLKAKSLARLTKGLK